jgi:mannosyl-3-phosphoglycerate phosphatase
MNPAHGESRLPLVVYTDLDGTLLDHDSYRFEPALPALRRLRALAVPVVVVSSKTIAELENLTRQLDLGTPFIAENGGLIAYPPDYFPGLEAYPTVGRFRVQRLSPDYRSIVSHLNELRTQNGYRFRGFSDLGNGELARLTGLSERDAGLAKQRLCSEPLLWSDSDQAMRQFSSDLEALGYTLVQGGRFWHVLGDTSKASAMGRLDAGFSARWGGDFTTIGLGDSPNDRSMLQAVDIAVVVRRKDGSWLTLERVAGVYRTRAAGPAGWNEFFQAWLDKAAPPDGERSAAEDSGRTGTGDG